MVVRRLNSPNTLPSTGTSHSSTIKLIFRSRFKNTLWSAPILPGYHAERVTLVSTLAVPVWKESLSSPLLEFRCGKSHSRLRRLDRVNINTPGKGQVDPSGHCRNTDIGNLQNPRSLNGRGDQINIQPPALQVSRHLVSGGESRDNQYGSRLISE